MKVGNIILLIAATVIISVVATKAILERQTRRSLSELNDQHSTDSDALSRIRHPRAASIPPKSLSANAAKSVTTNLVSGSNSNAANPRSPAMSSGEEPLQDPIARVALSLVGMDPDAEDYWFAAINDLTLPANERQNLIEDLNEEGLSD